MDSRPELPDSTDIAIIGGGVMGTSIAFFLTAETNLDVTVIEKNRIASGSTGDSSAVLRHHYGNQEIYSRMAWWSHQFYRKFEQMTGEPLAHGESPLVRFVEEESSTAEYAKAGYEVLSSLDIPTSRVESENLASQYPMFGNLERYDFAISDDAAGYSDGTDAANGFARAARQRGATVVTDTEVRSIEVADGRVTGVETDGGTVNCNAVVVAAGPWTPKIVVDVDVDIPITTTREQVVILDPPSDYKEAYPELIPTTAGDDGTWYVRPDFGEGILFATHHSGDEVDPDNYDSKPDEAVLLELTEAVSNAIPELKEAGIKGQYCGVYSDTPDHDFIIDQAGTDGCYFACGFSGHGFKHAPAVGKIMCDLISEGDSEFVDVQYFSLDRFEDNPLGHGKPEDNV